MERMRKIRAELSHIDSAHRFQYELGADVFIGEGNFVSGHSIEVNGEILKFSKAVIATGARAGFYSIFFKDSHSSNTRIRCCSI